MARMKRFLLIFITLISTFAFCAVFPAAHATTAKAETADSTETIEPMDTYAVAPTKNVWFYSAPDEEKGLFILPYTYYVKVLTVGKPFCEVQYLEDVAGYKKLTGYCLYDDLQFVDFVPQRPYLYLNLTLKYSLKDTDEFDGSSLGTYERPVVFYGTFYNGTALKYYVYADNQFAKVAPSDVKEELKYDYNTDYRTVATGAGDNGNTASSSNGLSAVQIAVICIVCAAAVAVAFFVLRGKKPPVAGADEGLEL